MQHTNTAGATSGPDLAAFGINEFCQAHSISRPFLYRLWKGGKGPRYIQLGARRLITAEAAADWRRAMENATRQGTS